MSDNKVNIEIDGKKIVAEQGSMIIEAADDHGVYIPRFCYHKKLSVAANCRMCLVELEGGRKPMPACATPISEGMKVKTRSALARKAQKAVMEFLLINHPLDCPICDQGGQCELQDLAMGYGKDTSRFDFAKHVVQDKNLGSLISTDMTRCINCTRCVRFTQEIAGNQELGVMGRGGHAEIGTYVERAVESEISGNIIDLCPVGALTSKPFRFGARAWELMRRSGVAAHDCLGSNIYVHTKDQQVKRIVPRSNESINESWLSDRDRFSYAGLSSEERVTAPLLKKDGKWQKVDWSTAFEIIASSFENVKKAYGANQLAALISPNASIEEQYLLQKLMREFGSNNIDHRIQMCDFRDQADVADFPQLGLPVSELEILDSVLLIGSDIQREQPLAAARILKAKNNNEANISVINPYDFDFHFAPETKVIATPVDMVKCLAAMLKALAPEQATDKLDVTEEIQCIAEQLCSGEKSAIILGAMAANCQYAADIRYYAKRIAELTGAIFGELTVGANSAGAWLAGAVPHRGVAGTDLSEIGLHAGDIMGQQQKAYLLYGIEPEYDCASGTEFVQQLKKADFVVCCSPFATDAMCEYADIILPTVPYMETAGTYVNCNGQWQTVKATAVSLGEARPGWKVLRVLANFLDLAKFDYVDIESVTAEIERAVDASETAVSASSYQPAGLPEETGLTRIATWPMYRSDNIVRRSEPLQQAMKDELAIYLHPETAESQTLQAGDTVEVQGVSLPVMLSQRVAKQCVYIPAAMPGGETLGAAFAAIELRRNA